MLHKHVVLAADDVIAGRGLVAVDVIREGEIVSKLEPQQPMYLISEVASWTQEAQSALLEHAYQCSETHIVNEQGNEKYMNHSCDPNTWWADDDTMIARRDIQAGEEITYDYATTEVALPFEMDCHCGSENCRGRVTHLDHRILAWQARFGTQLPQHTLKAIAAHKANSIA